MSVAEQVVRFRRIISSRLASLSISGHVIARHSYGGRSTGSINRPIGGTSELVSRAACVGRIMEWVCLWEVKELRSLDLVPSCPDLVMDRLLSSLFAPWAKVFVPTVKSTSLA